MNLRDSLVRYYFPNVIVQDDDEDNNDNNDADISELTMLLLTAWIDHVHRFKYIGYSFDSLFMP